MASTVKLYGNTIDTAQIVACQLIGHYANLTLTTPPEAPCIFYRVIPVTPISDGNRPVRCLRYCVMYASMSWGIELLYFINGFKEFEEKYGFCVRFLVREIYHLSCLGSVLFVFSIQTLFRIYF